MMWLKGCPRCHGDLFEEIAVAPELYGARTVGCLQCGYSLSADEERELPRSRSTEAVASSALRRGVASGTARP